jgi:benzoate 4-monooxygenase
MDFSNRRLSEFMHLPLSLHSSCSSLANVCREYYDAFVSIRRGLFSTRDRQEHSRKRKTISHTFSAQSVGQFEQYVHANIKLFVTQWFKICDTQTNPRTGYASIDALHWFNYLAFDIIGDLAFGTPFGMLANGKDIAQVVRTPGAPPTYAPAVQVLSRRGEVSSTLGCYPQLKPFAKYLPDRFFRNGLEAVEDLAGIAISRVGERLQHDGKNDRVDLLARLIEGKDETGAKLGREELTAEALTQLIAGSDTTSNTLGAILYWVLSTPGVVEKVQESLNEVLPSDVKMPSYAQLKDIL